MLVSRVNLAVFSFELLRWCLAQILVPYLNCDVGISRKFSCVRIQFNCNVSISLKFSCVLIRIVTLVSCANLAVLIFGLLRL